MSRLLIKIFVVMIVLKKKRFIKMVYSGLVYVVVVI